MPAARYLTAPRPSGIRTVMRSDGLPLGEELRAVRAATVLRARDRDRERMAQLQRETERAEALVKRLQAARRPTPKPARPQPSGEVPEIPEGAELRLRRQALGMTQRTLALCASISRSVITEVERGVRQTESARVQIAQALTRLEGAA